MTQPQNLDPDLQVLRDQRTYFVSDERLRAFAQLTQLQRLQWVEQCSHFVRMGQQARQADHAQEAGH
ncbi:MAG: hypothetical protein JNK28_04540 [Burkholderiaceae bacterium]|nr:hypothetical protein [Burkholderiaceae bacterium]